MDLALKLRAARERAAWWLCPLAPLFVAGLPPHASATDTPPQPARQSAPRPDAIVATVNGRALDARLLDVLVRSRTEPDDPYVEPAEAAALQPAEASMTAEQARSRSQAASAQALTDLIDTEVLAQAAERQGLLNEPAIAAEARLQQKTWTAQMYVRHLLGRMNIPEADIRARYAAQPAEYEYQVGQIRVASEDDARRLIARLQAGEKRAALAHRHTLDRQARDGNLGWLMTGQLPPAVAEVVRGLAPGALAPEPVGTEAGWHVVWLTHRRAMPRLPYEDLRAVLRAQILQERLQVELARLRAEATVDLRAGGMGGSGLRPPLRPAASSSSHAPGGQHARLDPERAAAPH